MATVDSAAYDTLGGYLSGDSKRKFTITTGILGAVFFVAQFILPFAMMIVMMPAMIMVGDPFTEFDARGAVLWDDAIWLTEKGPKGTVLKRIGLQGGQSPETVCELSARRPKLLADATGLWIISSCQVWRYDDQGLGPAVRVRTLGDCSRPFLANNQPAIVEDQPDGALLLTYDEDQWRRKRKLNLGERFRGANITDDLQVLSQGPMLHLFLRHGDTLYHKTTFLDEDLDGPFGWRAICPAKRAWRAALTERGVFAFCHQYSGATGKIVGYRTNGPSWDPFFSDKATIVESVGVCPLPGDTRFVLLGQLFPGALRMLHTDGAAVTNRTTLGRASFFPKGFPLLMMVPHVFTALLPLILAVVLSGMMRRHRVPTYSAESGSLPYASLTRRALAQAVDALILGGPYIVGCVLMMSLFAFPEAFFESEAPGMLAMPLLMCGGLLWVFLCLLAFSATEGSSGGTPGKWLLGIRVLGVDLKPCGFGRAFIRNILKFVDGFFNFMVGVMVAALSENWQRIGDMAVRTVVVDIRKTPPAQDILQVGQTDAPSP